MTMGKPPIAPDAVRKIESFLYQTLGWKIEIDDPMFETKISRVWKELGCGSSDACIRLLENRQSDAKVIQAFAREFSVGESYFFRDKHFFDRLQQHIIPQIMKKNERTLSVWSVGCSRGEELYSAAMLLRRMIPDIDGWNHYLLGTDVNPDVLDEAKKGFFNKAAFRQIPETYMDYFTPQETGYSLHPDIKKMAHFKYHNAMSDPLPCLPPDGRGFDLIFINNVLIYFEPEKAKGTAATLFSVVEEGGWLATTATEYSMGIFDFPHSQCLPGSYFIQKVFNPPSEALLPVTPIRSATDFSENAVEIDALEDTDSVIADVPQPDHLKDVPKRCSVQNNPFAYYRDALKMLESGEQERAKIFLRRALYLDKGMVMAHVVLGNILKKEGRAKAGMRQIGHAKALLQQMPPQEEVELSDGIRANDLLAMLNIIKEEDV